MLRLPRHRALALLTLCQGDEIWSIEYCRQHQVPDGWIEALADNFESGFQDDRQTIYVDDQVTNQYRGIRAVDLALRLGQSLGLDVDQVTATALNRHAIVRAIQDAVEDGE